MLTKPQQRWNYLVNTPARLSADRSRDWRRPVPPPPCTRIGEPRAGGSASATRRSRVPLSLGRTSRRPAVPRFDAVRLPPWRIMPVHRSWPMGASRVPHDARSDKGVSCFARGVDDRVGIRRRPVIVKAREAPRAAKVALSAMTNRRRTTVQGEGPRALQPENAALEPIYADFVQVIGVVVGVFREL